MPALGPRERPPPPCPLVLMGLPGQTVVAGGEAHPTGVALPALAQEVPITQAFTGKAFCVLSE